MTEEEYDRRTCGDCEGFPQMDRKAFGVHVIEVHGLDKSAQRERRLLTHTDGREFYAADYVWTVGGMTFYQSTRNRRAPDDMMRFV